jgi:hypothetical protein
MAAATDSKKIIQHIGGFLLSPVLGVNDSFTITNISMKVLSLLSKSLIIAIGILAIACEVQPSVDVNQDKIWVKYELIYNAPNDETTASAKFRFGNGVGTLLELSDPATVSFNGNEMLFNPLASGYEWKTDGLVSNGTFVYEDTDGSVFTNATPTIVSTEFPDTTSVLSLSKSQDYDLVWDGTALAPDQGVSVLIGPELFVEETDGAIQMTIYASRLQNLDKTAYLGFIERWERQEPVEATSVGGEIYAKYKGQRRNVEVNP